MKIGFSFLSLKTISVKRAIKQTKNLGGNTLELFGDLPIFLKGRSLEDPKGIRSYAEEREVFLTLHLPYIDINLSSFNDLIWEKSIESVRRSLSYAHDVGAKRVVLHCGSTPIKHPIISYMAKRNLKKALFIILEESKKYDIETTLENSYFDENDVFYKVEEFKRFVESFKGELKVCFDFGHAHISSQGISKSLEVLKPLITHIHIHDNFGKKDDHLPLGKGSIDFTDYLEFIRNFNGSIILEINSLHDTKETMKRNIQFLKGEI